jgi:aspartyl-tRNA(Asn)/glutamyl-tRNA(Gln) amidotransferase subunit A
VRIPAAWNHLVGLKTTTGVVPLDGVLPLSRQYDTAGPLAKTVADAAALFAVLSAARPIDLTGASLKGRRFLAPANCVWEGAEPALRTRVEKAISALARAGAEIVHDDVPEFDDVTELCNTLGNFFSPEAYAEWRQVIDTQGDLIHHEVLRRFKIADSMSALDTAEAFHKVRAMRTAYLRRVAGYDGVLMPTTPNTPPPIAPLEADTKAYAAANLAALHNTRLGNLLTLSAITLPAGLTEDGLPTGLMIFAAPRREAALLRIAAAAERAIANA